MKRLMLLAALRTAALCTMARLASAPAVGTHAIFDTICSGATFERVRQRSRSR